MAIKNTKMQMAMNAYFVPGGFVIEETPEEIVSSGKECEDLLKEWIIWFDKDKYKALYHLGFSEKRSWFTPSIEYLYKISDMLIQKLLRYPGIEYGRELVIDEITLSLEEIDSLIEKVPFVVGEEHVDHNWIIHIFNNLLTVFSNEIRAYEGTVARYFTELNSNMNVAGRVFFHLVENKDSDYPFAFMATYSTKAEKSRKALHTPLRNALAEYKGDEKLLLSLMSTVIKAADSSQLISDLMESGELFSPLKFTADEAYTFLKEIHMYEGAGIMCRVPDWWRKKRNSFQLSVSIGEKEPSRVGLDAIMDFSPSLKVGEEDLTEKELREFLAMAEGLVQYKGKWVEINKGKLKAVLEAFERLKDISGDSVISLGDAMRMELNMDKVMEMPSEDVEISVSNGQWLRMLRESLVKPKAYNLVEGSESFKGNLREYQEIGFQWLNKMSQFGFGACLADDMGLGKTVQVIAFLEHSRVNHGGRALLVIPASLLGNWQMEVEKFAPEMEYKVLHKSAGNGFEGLDEEDSTFLYITTYGMVSRLDEIRERIWDYLILDEAQAIKNSRTKQTRSVKEINSRMRIALTGTPIENRLGDLWSLFDFLNQGLLGTAKEFSGFTKQLNEDGGGYEKLRKMIQPFILRRLKTDKSIISDLPEKIEINEYSILSKKQIALYRQLVDKIAISLDSAEGIERKGLILSSIMRFKQICNHPDQYMGREEFKPENSGKFQLLREICETIHEKRERVLVFTQFREMTGPISDFLEEIFQKEGLVLHGGTPVKKRNEMVERFSGDHYVPFMVLSLKAGGVGLNLTAANHVVHFDRWWNPAVENQATDRAFRIGQSKNVMVHKFISKGTIEEKIDAMIAEKQKLAGDILSSTGEQWITEYDNEQLMKLFLLGGED
jgi:non-specific serine/threonine protein kinase